VINFLFFFLSKKLSYSTATIIEDHTNNNISLKTTLVVLFESGGSKILKSFIGFTGIRPKVKRPKVKRSKEKGRKKNVENKNVEKSSMKIKKKNVML
jgi:hypothetical protein